VGRDFIGTHRQEFSIALDRTLHIFSLLQLDGMAEQFLWRGIILCGKTSGE
jgi:hypothetical protein